MTNPPHPSFVFTKEQIIGEIAYSESVQDGEGSEIGAMTGLESGATVFLRLISTFWRTIQIVKDCEHEQHCHYRQTARGKPENGSRPRRLHSRSPAPSQFPATRLSRTTCRLDQQKHKKPAVQLSNCAANRINRLAELPSESRCATVPRSLIPDPWSPTSDPCLLLSFLHLGLISMNTPVP